MRVLLIRHAIAEDRDAYAKSGKDDALRPLTRIGRRKMRRAAKGIRVVAPGVTLLVTSPLIRAVETAEIVADAYGSLKPVQVAQLAPGRPVRAVLQWLQQQPSKATVALVGHEPQLGILTSWLLTGLQESFVVYRKGGACLLEFGAEVKPARAKLLWFIKPGQLRELA